LSVNFRIDKGRFDKALNAFASRATSGSNPVLEVTPEGLIGYDKATSQWYSYFKADKDFLEEVPNGSFAIVVTKGLLTGLKQMASGIIKVTLQEVSDGVRRVVIEEDSKKGPEVNMYHEEAIIPEGDELGFPKSLEKFKDGVLQIVMEAPLVCVVDVDAIKIQELTATNVERYETYWDPAGSVKVVIELDSGGVIEKTFPVKFFDPPSELFQIDLEPSFLSPLMSTFLGEVRLTLHKFDSGQPAGITATLTAKDHDIGHTLAAMNPK
jgi:hypothetical protein